MFVEHIAIWVRDLEKWPNFMKRILVPNVLKNITTPRQGFNLIFAFWFWQSYRINDKAAPSPWWNRYTGLHALSDGSEKPSGSGCLCPTFCLRWLSSAERSPHNRGWLLWSGDPRSWREFDRNYCCVNKKRTVIPWFGVTFRLQKGEIYSFVFLAQLPMPNGKV